MPAVLLTAPYMIPYRERFQPVFDHYGLEVIQPVVNERLSEAELLAHAGQFDGTICGDDKYTPRVIDACLPRLKVISKWGTGIDSIDKAHAEAHGTRVMNTLNAFTLPVSDTVLGYILAFARQIPWSDHLIKTNRWEKLKGKALSECTLGVIGVGNIGKAVLRRAAAFGMRLLGNDIQPIARDFLAEHRIEMLPLDDLLAQSDFVSVNCDLNPTSFHIINEQTLAKMKPGAVLVNTARGPLVDEPALIAALQSGHLAGAGLDVFEVEPLPDDSPLKRMPNVLLAAHNSNSSPSAWEAIHWSTLLNLLIGLGMETSSLDEFRKTI